MKIPEKPKEIILSEAESKGYEFERKYHGCAQCVLGPLMEIFDMKEPEAFKAATGLGGGVGPICSGLLRRSYRRGYGNWLVVWSGTGQH